VGDVEPELSAADGWIGVVPVGTEEPAEGPRGAKEESFTTAVVTKMKRALVLGASALLILALNQNAIRELDVSQLLAKPVIVIQSSDNVTRLLGALLRLPPTLGPLTQPIMFAGVVLSHAKASWD
ncbi:hypothetical protein EK904_010872, partial [Melospiza melodia maxima]